MRSYFQLVFSPLISALLVRWGIPWIVAWLAGIGAVLVLTLFGGLAWGFLSRAISFSQIKVLED